MEKPDIPEKNASSICLSNDEDVKFYLANAMRIIASLAIAIFMFYPGKI